MIAHEADNKMTQSNIVSLFGPTLMTVDGDPVRKLLTSTSYFTKMFDKNIACTGCKLYVHGDFYSRTDVHSVGIIQYFILMVNVPANLLQMHRFIYCCT